MAKTVMVFGVGAVGGWALQLLGRSEGVDRIVAADTNEEVGASRMNSAAAGSIFQGFSKTFEFRRGDANDIDMTARLLEEIRPDVIFLSASVHSAGILSSTLLPEDVRDKILMAGFGAQLPWHLLLPAKFMEALRKSAIQTHVVSSPFPDVVNPALWKHFGFGPTAGVGNSELKAARIIKQMSTIEGVPAHDITLYFVGSHALGELSRGEKVPFFLKILLGDRDITSKYDASEMTPQKRPLPVRYADRITGEPGVRLGEELAFTVGASAVKNVMAIIRDTNEFTHVTSPGGLIGGYPARLSAKGAEVILPKELTLEQAIKINEDAEKFDGVENIKDDGTIVLTDKCYSIMKELGYDCKELPFDELESRSEELERLRKSWLQN